MRKSFNLIEILIVVSVIGILAAMTLNYAKSARLRARDATRKNDMQTLRLNMVNYKQANSIYPGAGASNVYSCASQGGAPSNWTSTLLPALAAFASTLPSDPIGKCNGGLLVSKANDATKNPNDVYDYWVYTQKTNANNSMAYGILSVLEINNSSVSCATTYSNGGCHDLARETYVLSADSYVNTHYYTIGCQYDAATQATRVAAGLTPICPEKQ
ncbi:MAG: type II secretion system protein [Patescibacteria group bacterium]|jgi:prepilin-type N-terminal cleavage/methylation domain-containing protein